MRLVIEDSGSEGAGFWVASYVKKRIIEFQPTQERPFVLGVASGVTTIPIFRNLVHFVRKGELSFENVVTFNLDEYIGVPRDHKHSKHSFMWHNFFKHIDIKRENVHILDGEYKELGKQFKKNKLSYQQKKAKIKQKIAYGLYTMENA